VVRDVREDADGLAIPADRDLPQESRSDFSARGMTRTQLSSVSPWSMIRDDVAYALQVGEEQLALGSGAFATSLATADSYSATWPRRPGRSRRRPGLAEHHSIRVAASCVVQFLPQSRAWPAGSARDRVE